MKPLFTGEYCPNDCDRTLVIPLNEYARKRTGIEEGFTKKQILLAFADFVNAKPKNIGFMTVEPMPELKLHYDRRDVKPRCPACPKDKK